MTTRTLMMRLLENESLNFVVTNCIPRVALTRFMAWFSRIEQPFVRDVSLRLWHSFADLRLHEARKESFRSVHDCFVRELKAGVRPIEGGADLLISPCDAIVGAMGKIDNGTLIQAKGFPYSLAELLCDPRRAEPYRNGSYVTLRITSTMYHRFHAPLNGTVEEVVYVAGDVWNVNPPALKRVHKLYCRNERAVLRVRVDGSDDRILLVPVAAVLVASIRLHFLNVLLSLRYTGPNVLRCNAQMKKGQEMGWFEHGSTIIVIAPEGYELCASVVQGEVIRMGQALLKRTMQEST